jgi:hypothetical protein
VVVTSVVFKCIYNVPTISSQYNGCENDFHKEFAHMRLKVGGIIKLRDGIPVDLKWERFTNVRFY